MTYHKTLGVLAGLLLLVACGDDDAVTCGDGTVLHNGSCTIADAGPADDTPDAAADAGAHLTCGTGTVAVRGKCVATDAGAGQGAGGNRPIGTACAETKDCASGTCAPEADNLPGGMCTLIGCNMDKPCPVGSTCYALNPSFSLCMPYCDRDAQCRSDENYHCQPLYTTGVNICSPSCELTKSCTAGTRCNADSGLCELAECDVKSPGNACTKDETCWTDSKGLSSKGGLCLHLCKPSEPEKSCNTDQKEVCQPLAADPANTGFCAPPVCSKTAECPAGAECKNSVCQPPALCGDDNHCADDKTTCVSGKCMPKCPSDNKHCADIHPGLVCADVLSVPACLPLGTFPGSACVNNQCESVKIGDGSAPMVCQDDKCLVDCTNGGQNLCSGLSDTLQCAHGIFATDLCLPKGTYPGSACGANNTCAQDLNGDPAVDMSCVNGSCVIGCAENGKWSGYGDALCSLVDASLTCATQAGSICVRACSSEGSCDSGYSCLDKGAVPAHENACLPNGTFPGSACRPSSGDACDSDLGGNAAIDMVCVNDSCVVSCPSNNDALCTAVDPRLTCSESAGNLCVLGCASGACLPGFACLDPGASPHQNACLPTGSFPGSPCRDSGDNRCDQNVGGNAALDLTCANNTCTPACPNNNDALCAAVDPRLTCAESAGNLCVFACVTGACPSGYSCLDPGDSTHQNACLPTGSFPTSPCRTTGDSECDQNLGGNADVDMVCVANSCVVSCPNNNDLLCGAVDSRLTCSESAGNLCVFKCGAAGVCPSGQSCFDPGASPHQNACLPNGSFPGSACRPSGSDKCDQNLNGNPNIDLKCVQSTCLLSCPSDNNALCAAVDSSLTCAAIAGNVCLPACVNNACSTGFACYAPETVCIPSN